MCSVLVSSFLLTIVFQSKLLFCLVQLVLGKLNIVFKVFVTNSQSGMGLLKCGNIVIPFDNQISKDTSLYKLYNTNLHEQIAEQRAKKNHVSVV